MKKTFLIAGVVTLFAGVPLSYAAQNFSVKKDAKVASLNSVYKGYAYTDEVYGNLYFYGESRKAPVTLVKNSNGEVVNATVKFVEDCGFLFAYIQINGDSFYAPLQ